MISVVLIGSLVLASVISSTCLIPITWAVLIAIVHLAKLTTVIAIILGGVFIVLVLDGWVVFEFGLIGQWLSLFWFCIIKLDLSCLVHMLIVFSGVGLALATVNLVYFFHFIIQILFDLKYFVIIQWFIIII